MSKVATSEARIPILVFLTLFLVYASTIGGHTSSPDEEGMFHIADSLLTDMCFCVHSDELSTTSDTRIGTDGRNYSPSGIATSLMEVPFIAIGRLVASTQPPEYQPMLIRLVANLMDPLLTAATAVVLYGIAANLGYSQRASSAVAMLFGLTTIAWPYSKYLWSEPVTAFWLLLSFFLTTGKSQGRKCLAFGAGACLGISAASKISTLIAGIGFFVYFAILLGASLRSSREIRPVVVRVMAFGSGLLVLVGLIGLYNLARFGSFAETGYGAIPIKLAGYGGITGLLFSSGKSVFLYSPLTFLFVPALVPFASKHTKEAAFVVCVVAAHIVFYGSIEYWHGDAAWGPRYLVPITAFMMLPLVTVLESKGRGLRASLARAAIIGLTCLGLLVQVGGVLVNYATYTIQTGETFGELADARRRTPMMSPLIQHWRLLDERIDAWRLQPDAGVEIGSGFYPPEGIRGAQLPRWTNGAGELKVVTSSQSPLVVFVEYQGHGPPSLEPNLPRLSANGRQIPPESMRLSFDQLSGAHQLAATIPMDGITDRTVLILVESNPWSPAASGDSKDKRVLGVSVTKLLVGQDSVVFPVREATSREYPASTLRPWSPEAFAWFYNPQQMHLLDIWAWYLWAAGVSQQMWVTELAVLAAAGMFGGLLVRSRQDFTKE